MFSLNQNGFQSVKGMLDISRECVVPQQRMSDSAPICTSHIGAQVPYFAYLSLEVFVQQESIASVFLQLVMLFTILLKQLLKMLLFLSPV